MDLPQELIDEITCNLASDIPSLLSCSSVAKSWIYPSRRWLFKDVLVSRGTRQRWLDRISPTNVELLHNIRSFTYITDSNAWGGNPLYRIYSSSFHRYLPSLCRLENLGLHAMSLGPDVPQQIGLFSTFQYTLSSLRLRDCRVTSNALITLINYFPLLADLDLWSVDYAAVSEPAPRLSRPLRGRLGIAYCGSEDRALFNKLSNPPPELDELVLYWVDMPTFYDAILGVHGGSVKCLKMTDSGGYKRRMSCNPQIFPTLTRNTNSQ